MNRLHMVNKIHYFGDIVSDKEDLVKPYSLDDSVYIGTISNFYMVGNTELSFRVYLRNDIYDIVKDHEFLLKTSGIAAKTVFNTIILEFPKMTEDEFLLLKLSWP